jgi:single-stranded-DNA-specific exonuclease
MQKKIIRRSAETHSNFINHPLLKRIYDARGVKTNKELEHDFHHLLPYESLLGLEQAMACLYEALKEEKKILIVGDFDADGATSTAVAIRSLHSFGVKNVDFLVPNRFSFGYGLTPELVDVAYEQFNPALIVTVDNGIANHAGVQAAKQKGIKVVITDHHLAAETLPEADAIVNPNQPFDTFPSKHIAGVGVIFYVMLSLRRYLSDKGWFEEKKLPMPNMSKLLDIVALGTVADVVPLDHNNRILVQQGLRRIRARHCIPGIIALLEIGNRDHKHLVASDLGFVVAPRLNAAGRLDDMSLGIECLLTDDLTRAREIAQTLNQLNDERRLIEQEMQEQALHALQKCQMDTANIPYGLCLFDEEWHQGVIGILASRIKDRYHRPVIAFALANDDELKGSARSISGVHIRDVLAIIAAQYPDLIKKFGGHAMAAGLTIARSSFELFSNVFNDVIAAQVKEEYLESTLWSDGELESTELTLPIAELLRDAGPWGHAFPEPLFDGHFELVEQRLVGGKHLKMTVAKEGVLLDAIAFNVDLNQWPNYRLEYVKMAYKLDINEFRNKRKVQLIVEHLEIM